MGIVAQVLNAAVQRFVVETPFGHVRPVKYVVPFVNTLANVTEAGMDFTPIGIWRGMHGRHIVGKADSLVEFSAQEARERIISGVLGTTAIGFVYALAGEGENPEDPFFDLYAEGPQDTNKRNQMRNAGWNPYSMKLGNQFINYKESPLGLALSVVGGIRDLQRYSKYDEKDAMLRAAYVLGVVPRSMTSQGALQGVESIGGLLSGKPNEMRRMVQSFGRGFVPAQGLLRDVGRVFDPELMDSKTIHGAILKDVPIIRRTVNEPALNRFGEPVKTVGLGRIPVVSRIASSRVSDPEIDFLAQHGLWLPGYSDVINVGAGLTTKGEEAAVEGIIESRVQKMGRLKAGVLTDAEARDYLRRQGVFLRRGLKHMRQRQDNGYGFKDQPAMQAEVDRIAAIANKMAMREMLGFRQR